MKYPPPPSELITLPNLKYQQNFHFVLVYKYQRIFHFVCQKKSFYGLGVKVLGTLQNPTLRTEISIFCIRSVGFP